MKCGDHYLSLLNPYPNSLTLSTTSIGWRGMVKIHLPLYPYFVCALENIWDLQTKKISLYTLHQLNIHTSPLLHQYNHSVLLILISSSLEPSNPHPILSVTLKGIKQSSIPLLNGFFFHMLSVVDPISCVFVSPSWKWFINRPDT